MLDLAGEVAADFPPEGFFPFWTTRSAIATPKASTARMRAARISVLSPPMARERNGSKWKEEPKLDSPMNDGLICLGWSFRKMRKGLFFSGIRQTSMNPCGAISGMSSHRVESHLRLCASHCTSRIGKR
jgi:hypothetical protein